MTTIQKQLIFTLNITKLIEFVYHKGYQIIGGEIYRLEGSVRYKITDPSTPNASNDCDKLIIELYLFSNGSLITEKRKYKPLIRFWRSLHPNNRSNYKAPPNHFEMV